MFQQLLKFFIVFFVVVEPISLIPVFAALIRGGDASYRHRMAFKAAAISLGICVLATFAGARFLQLMGISLSAFRLAGGCLLFLFSLEMVFARQSGSRTTASEAAECAAKEDISVFPLAFPFIAGPGALATILLEAGDVAGKPMLFAGVLGVMLLVIVICWAVMVCTPTLMKLLGVTGANVANRLSGVVLAALAVQFMVDGIRGSFLS